MTRSHFIQFGIMVLIILLIYFTYSYINKSRKDSNIVEKTELNKLVEEKISKNEETLDKNVISELTYKSLDDNGNIYEINSDSGSIQENDKSTLLLKKGRHSLYHDLDILNLHFHKNEYLD